MFRSYPDILFISRPHIWLYTLGSFFLGLQLAQVFNYEIQWLNILPLLVLLTVPVNFFIYALNDYFDSESDLENPKKESYEYRSVNSNSKLLYLAVGMWLFTLTCIAYQGTLIFGLFVLWTILVVTYNLPPFRFKARPGLDMLFALNFPLWGLIGYVAVVDIMPDLYTLIPVTLIAAAFHQYTAIHDRPYDAKAGVRTSAVFVGSLLSNIIVCIVLMFSAMVFLTYFGWLYTAGILSLYIIFFAAHLIDTLYKRNLLHAYKHFICMHYVVGFLVSVSFLAYV